MVEHTKRAASNEYRWADDLDTKAGSNYDVSIRAFYYYTIDHAEYLTFTWRSLIYSHY